MNSPCLTQLLTLFGAPTAIHSFLSFEKYGEYVHGEGKDGQAISNIWLISTTKIQQRIRCEVWQAPGDIGDFNDGVGLMLCYLMSQFAATKFVMELLSGTKVDK